MTERPAVLISIEVNTADELRHAVNSGLYAYNDKFAGPMGNSVLTIGARDVDRKIIGGLIADLQTGWKWMHVHRLWVDESHRRAGIGRRLLEAAEQALGFYEKQGYSVYAVQEDYPVGHRKFLLKKTFPRVE